MEHFRLLFFNVQNVILHLLLASRQGRIVFLCRAVSKVKLEAEAGSLNSGGYYLRLS